MVRLWWVEGVEVSVDLSTTRECQTIAGQVKIISWWLGTTCMKVRQGRVMSSDAEGKAPHWHAECTNSLPYIR